jgi:signal transduction histidine kinase
MEFNPLVTLRRSVLALPLAAMVALVVVVINESGYKQSTEELSVLIERGVARQQLQTLLRGLVDTETGQRGYLLTGRKDYLEPYNTGLKAYNTSVEKLRDYFANDPIQRVRVEAIDSNARMKLTEMAITLEQHERGEEAKWRALVMSDVGKQTMDALRAEAAELLASENQRIAAQIQGVFSTMRINRIGVNIMAAVSLAALLLFLRKTQLLDRAQFDHARALGAERDQLEGQIALRTADLTELTQHLEVAREDERSRLARELHDELGALLTAAKLDVARLKRAMSPMSPTAEEGLKHLQTTLDQGIALKRNIIENLRPSSLSNLGLVSALEIQAREFSKRTEIAVHTELEPVVLSDGAQITIYRLVQESLTNIAKYAKASEVMVTLSNEAGRVRISVRDNGRGFDTTMARRGTHGLSGMHYRVGGQGGEMQITSTPGEGTTIAAWLPAGAPASLLRSEDESERTA